MSADPSLSARVCVCAQSDGVTLICATNLAEALDPALTRPGRIDRIIHVPFPSKKERIEVSESQDTPASWQARYMSIFGVYVGPSVCMAFVSLCIGRSVSFSLHVHLSVFVCVSIPSVASFSLSLSVVRI